MKTLRDEFSDWLMLETRNARVRLWAQDHTFSLIGRPRGPQMQCGWQCGAALTSHRLRSTSPDAPTGPCPVKSHATPHLTFSFDPTGAALSYIVKWLDTPVARPRPILSVPLYGKAACG
jgi:hypothetical protein